MKYLRTVSAKLLSGTALLRLDFNTEDEWRMEATAPTIRFLIRRTKKIVIMSHRGRPEGADPKFSLKKDARLLSRLIRRPVRFLPHFRFEEIRREIETAPKHSVFLLENLRFEKGEEVNDPAFAGQLASLADFYVNDAFAVSHRDDASVDAITRFLPSYAGLILEQEIASLGKLLKAPERPLVVVIGGAKAHDKLDIINRFRKKADWFLLGGAAANTLLYLRGRDVGKSLIDGDKKDYPELTKAAHYPNLLLPVDWKEENKMIFDIGPRTAALYAEKIKSARTIIWSGPLGFIEKKKFASGTLAIARAAAGNRKAFSLTGGGETVMFLKKNQLDKKFSFISTGGGAMVDFLSGKKLPGIVALERKNKKHAR